MTVTFGCIGDLHGHSDRLNQVIDWLTGRPLAAALFVGDFARGPLNPPNERIDESLVASALESAQRLGVPLLFVPGNHDQRRQAVAGNVDGTCQIIEGVCVAGIGGAGPAHFGFPYEWSEDEIRQRRIPRPDILLSHAPPARTTLDVLSGTSHHAGSEAVRELAETMSGVLVCGHIHEGVGVEIINQCLCYNVGSLGEPHGRLQVGILEFGPNAADLTHYDLEAGSSWSASLSRTPL